MLASEFFTAATNMSNNSANGQDWSYVQVQEKNLVIQPPLPTAAVKSSFIQAPLKPGKYFFKSVARISNKAQYPAVFSVNLVQGKGVKPVLSKFLYPGEDTVFNEAFEIAQDKTELVLSAQMAPDTKHNWYASVYLVDFEIIHK